jgi:tetratricopeptide (TPR) repeat protein
MTPPHPGTQPFPPPLVITVRRQKNTAFYDLAEVDPLIRAIQIEFDQQLLSRINSELATITDSMKTYHSLGYGTPLDKAPVDEGTVAGFKKLGRVIYEHLFPDTLREILSDRPPSNLFLRLEETLLEIPWELAFDGKDFLSRKFHIGRQIITSLPFHKSFDAHDCRSTPQTPRLLLIVDPTESLPAAFEEIESLAEALDQESRLEVEIIGGRRASKLEVLSALSEFELVHFAGHSTFNPTDASKSGWLLYDGILSSEEINKVSHPPQLVFSNSCQSAATRAWSPGQANLGIGSRFLLAGVRHYVGALWVIHDSGSARFAEAFYKSLFQGKTIGEALFYAKTEDLGTTDFEALLTTGYVHYGRPDDRILAPPLKDVQREITRDPELKADSAQSRLSGFARGTSLKVRLLALSASILFCALAVASYRHSVPPGPASAGFADYRKGLEEYAMGNIPKALSLFQHLTRRDDNPSGLGFGELAEIYLEAGAVQEARLVLVEALGKPVHNPRIYLLKGHLAFQEGNVGEAEKAYAQALLTENGLPEQTAEAYNALGVLHFLSGRKESALDFFDKALSSQPANPEALFNLGFIACREGAQTRGKDFMSRLIHMDPQDEPAALLLRSTRAIAGGPSPVAPGTGDETILIGPFYLGGGTVKRLGYDWVFAHLVSDMLAQTNMGHRFRLETTTALDAPFAHWKPSDSPTLHERIRTALQPLAIKTVVFGDLAIFRHVAYVNVKAMDVASGAVIRSIKLKAEDPEKIKRLAERLKDEIAGSFAVGALKGSQ